MKFGLSEPVTQIIKARQTKGQDNASLARQPSWQDKEARQ